MDDDRRNYLLVALLVFIPALALLLSSSTADLEFLPDNPTRSVAETSILFWNTGRLERAELKELFLNLESSTRTNPRINVWQDKVSVGQHGEIYPKHAVIFAILCSFFYGILGIGGFWIANQFFLLGVLLGIYKISRQLSSAKAALHNVFFFALTTGIIFTSFGLSYDLFGAACIVLSACCLLSAPFLAGALTAASVTVRPTLLYFVVVFFALSASSRGKRSSGRTTYLYGLGSLVFLCPIFLFNYKLWGAPLRGAYARLPIFRDGTYSFDESTHAFSPALLVNNFVTRFALGDDALLLWYPGLVVPLAVYFFFLVTRRVILPQIALGTFGLLYLLGMMGFPLWVDIGSWRFVLPGVCLLWPVTMFLFRSSASKKFS